MNLCEPGIDSPIAGLVIPRDTRRALGDCWTGWIFAATIPACTLVYSFQLVTFADAKEAVFGLGMTIAATGLLVRGGVSLRGIRAFLPLWVGLIATAAVTLGPAMVRLPWRVVEEGLRLAMFLASTAVVYDLIEQQVWRARFRSAFLFSAAAAACLGLLQYLRLVPGWFPAFQGNDQRIYSVFANQDLFGGFMAMAIALLFPSLAAGRRNWRTGLAVWALLLAALALSASRSAWAAAAVGLIAAFPWRRWRAGALAAVVTVTLLVTAAGVLVTPERTWRRVTQTFGPADTGGNLRLWFWESAVRMAAEAPLTGVGLGNFPFWSPHYQAKTLTAPGGMRHAHNELHTAEPHCEPLRLLAETGLIGVIFAVWMVLALLKGRGPEWGAVAALAVFALFNGAFLSPPHALSGFLFSAMLLARRSHIPLTQRDSLLSAALLAVLVSALAFGIFWTRTVPSYLIVHAENEHLAGGDTLSLYERALQHPWPNPEGREEYGLALLEQSRWADALVQFELARSGLDTGRIHLRIAQTAERLGDREAARSAYAASLWRWPANPVAWKGLYRLSPEAVRSSLREHAVKWGIPLVKRKSELTNTAPQNP